MAKLQQNLRSAMEYVIETVNAMRTEVGEYAAKKGQQMKYRVWSIIAINELNNSEEVRSTIAMVSAEVAELKEKMEEFLVMLEKSQKKNMEDAETDQEVEIRRLKMENEELKRDNWSLNESLKCLKNLEKIERAKKSIANQYHDRLLRFQNARVCTRPQMNEFNLFYENGMFPPDFTWKIDGIRVLLQQDTFQIESQEFSWNEYPDVRARANLEQMSGGWLYVSLSLGLKRIRNPINSKLILPTVYYVLKDRSGQAEPDHVIRSSKGLLSVTYQHNVKCLMDHKSRLIGPSYNVADCVVLEVYVEPPEAAQTAHSTDGTLEWTVDNCRKMWRFQLTYLIYLHPSPYFYTAPEGYRVRVWLWLSGMANHAGLGLSADVDFIGGEFDEDLSYRFPHRTTVTLVNRKNPECSIKTTVEKMRGERYYTLPICTFQEMEKLLENDTMLFNFVIERMNKYQ